MLFVVDTRKWNFVGFEMTQKAKYYFEIGCKYRSSYDSLTGRFLQFFKSLMFNIFNIVILDVSLCLHIWESGRNCERPELLFCR